jgi:hypothetical protein
MTNVMHKCFSMYLFLFITLYMFRAHRAHHQERQIVSIQCLVTVNLCWWPRRVDDTATNSYQRLYWHNLSLLMMSTMCSKHVESYKWKDKYIERNLCITLCHLPRLRYVNAKLEHRRESALRTQLFIWATTSCSSKFLAIILFVTSHTSWLSLEPNWTNVSRRFSGKQRALAGSIILRSATFCSKLTLYGLLLAACRWRCGSTL